MSLDEAKLQKLLNLIQVYQAESTVDKVVNFKDYNTLNKEWHELSKNVGHENWDLIWKTLEKYLRDSVKTAHPQYFNQLWGGRSDVAWLGEVVSTLANTSMYTYEVAPVATYLETKLLEHLKIITHFENGEAQFTTGGSNGNWLSLMLALHQKFPVIKTQGMRVIQPVAIFVSAEAHYSFDKAVNILGLGTDSLFRVEVDSSGAMQVADLVAKIRRAQQAGRKPIYVAATAGTTIRGAFDSLEKIAVIASKEDLWFHVDGAWGGSVVLSSQHKNLLKGLDKADSFVWDAHKMLGLPLMCSMLFARHKGLFNQVFNLGDTSYIFHGEGHDLGPSSLQCGRRVDILKWWLEWQFYGPNLLGDRVDKFIDLAKYAEERINQEPFLELQADRVINNVCFRFISKEIKDLNSFNKSIRNYLYQAGLSFVNTAYLGKDLTIRLILTNASLSSKDVDEFFDNFLSVAHKLLSIK